jgi:hypothetical protein
MTRASAKPGTWTDLLGIGRGAFGAASFCVFENLMCGWVLAPGRRTITAMIGAGGEAPGKSQGCPFHSGTSVQGTGECSEPSVMPREAKPRMNI